MLLKSLYLTRIELEYKLLFKDKAREGGEASEIVSRRSREGGGVGGAIMADRLQNRLLGGKSGPTL